MSRARLLLVPLGLVSWFALHCGGGETSQPTTPTATPSASAPPAASSSAAAVEPAGIQCPAPKPVKPEQAPSHPAACPDVSTQEAVAKLDFAKAFKVDKKLAAELKENAAMAVAIRALTTRVDATMKDGCAKLLADFGCTGDYGNVQGACDAAADVLKQATARLGPNARVSTHIEMPHCPVASQPALDCLKKCALSFKGKADALKCDGTSAASGCEGAWSAPGVSDACTTTCALELAAGATCTPTAVQMTIDGATDAKAADQLKSAVEKDLHGALLVEAAHGRVDLMTKPAANALKLLGPDLEKLEKATPPNKAIGDCYDGVMTDEALELTDLALETMLNLRVTAELLTK